MKYRRQKDGSILLGLERGDPVNAAIEEIARKEGIEGAEVHAIGAIEDPELGYYRLSDKTYLRRTLKGIWELAPLVGNITLKDGKPFLHAHVTIGGEDLLARCGHLFEARTGVVIEVFIRPTESPLQRFHCEEIGLPRWEP